MGFYRKISFILFGEVANKIEKFFPEVKLELKRARLVYSAQEYLSIAIMTSFIIFLCEIPSLAFIFGFLFKTFLFAFITSFTVSFFLSIGFFFFFIQYPRMIANRRAKRIDRDVPVLALYLSTISKSNLPISHLFRILTRIFKRKELGEELSSIVKNTEIFGLDITTSIEKVAKKTPSEKLKELLWGIISTIRGNADISLYLKEKSNEFLNRYKSMMNKLSRNLSI